MGGGLPLTHWTCGVGSSGSGLLKIIHLNNTANVAWRLARAQERLGHPAKVASFGKLPYGFPTDMTMPILNPKGAGPFIWNADMFSRWRFFRDFDVLHVHMGFSKTQWPFYLLYKKLFPQKVLVAHLHGSDVRLGYGTHYLELADIQFIATPDLAHWLPRASWLPNPIDLPPLPSPPANPVPRFGHFPSRPEMKGTDKILEFFHRAFGPSREERMGPITRHITDEAELLVVTKTPQQEALRIMQGCDAVIDQYSSFGAYGYVAIEAMAFAKPVLSKILPDLFPGCPIVPIDSVFLGKLASDLEYCREKGREGRDYVARVHESGTVARRVLRAYYEAIRSPALTPSEASSYWQSRGRTYAFEPKGKEFADQAQELRRVLATLEFESALEIGCGYGRIGRIGTPWLGVDLSRDQLLNASRGGLGGSLVQGEASLLPFRSGSLDLALAVEVLMHVPPAKILRVAADLKRVARKYIVHLDWFEDYLLNYGTGLNWVHDYPGIWHSLGLEVHEFRLKSTAIQSIFIVGASSGQNP